MFHHILLATDGSEASEKASLLAIDLAKKHQAKLCAVYVIDPYPYLGISTTNPAGFSAYVEAAQSHAQQTHQKISDLCAKQAPNLDLQCLLLEDISAPEGIIQAATDQHCDLIVIGSHGRHGLSRALLGSVAAKVVNTSNVPVLVAR
jgi:nucleotide-binding universal stress UspA family protein